MDEFGFVFALLGEGAPDEEILKRLSERRPERVSSAGAEDRAYFGRLAERLGVYRDNIADDAKIPDDVAVQDELYAKQRAFAREILPRLHGLIGRIADLSAD